MKKISEGLRRFVERAPTGADNPDLEDKLDGLIDDLGTEVENVISDFCKKNGLKEPVGISKALDKVFSNYIEFK